MRSLLSFLLVHCFISLAAQRPEGDTLKKNSFSAAPYGSFHYVEVASTLKGKAFEKGIEFRGDIALGDAGSGLALGLSAFHQSHFWKDSYKRALEREYILDHSDLALHGGYFTRIRPFKWNPRIEGGVSKLRFEYLWIRGFHFRPLSNAGDGHSLKVGLHHARPFSSPFWFDIGLRVGYTDRWPGITGRRNQTLIRSFSAGLSVGLQIRSGEKGAYP